MDLAAKFLLVTTTRDRCHLSPLHGYFEQMKDAARSPRQKNFTLDLDSPQFTPEGRNRHEIADQEFADELLADNQRTLYGLSE